MILDFEELKSCIENLQMRENYQPVMIKTLLESPNYEAKRHQIISKLKEANRNEDRDYGQIFWDVIHAKFGNPTKIDQRAPRQIPFGHTGPGSTPDPPQGKPDQQHAQNTALDQG